MRQFKITERITGRETQSFKAYLKEVAKIDLFPTPEAEAECAQKAFEGSDSAVDELVRRNLRFVVSVAKQYARKDVPVEDLVNEGNIGLVEAARRFDPSAGNKFISYAVWYIRKDIMSYLSKKSREIRLPINKINSMTDFNNKVSEIKQTLGREVGLEDLLGTMDGFTDNAIIDMLNIQNSTMTSMDSPLSIDGDGGTLHDVMGSNTFKETDHLIVDENNAKTLESVMSCLDDRAQDILKMYFGIGYDCPMNLHEVGERVGLTREGVRQIKEKSLKRIRFKARQMGIKSTMF
jgi:RNA polymerase primary sigma factor